MIRFEVPIPPSANRLQRTGRGRHYMPKTYVEWLAEAGLEATKAMRALTPADYPIAVAIDVRGGKGWRATRDIDNTIKPVLDMLRKSGLIEEDSTPFVSHVSATFHPARSKKALASCTVRVVAREAAP